jgi:hypothetical protein
MDDLDELIARNQIHRLADRYAVDGKDVDSSVSGLPDRCRSPPDNRCFLCYFS